MDRRYGFVNGCFHLLTQSHQPFLGTESERLASHQEQLAGTCVHRGGETKNVERVHPVSVDGRRFCVPHLVERGLDQGHGARRLAVGVGVDQNGGFISVL